MSVEPRRPRRRPSRRARGAGRESSGGPQFVAILAHDVRTPLAAIIGSGQTLQLRDHDLSPEQREQLIAVIGREADRLASLLGEALDTARIDTDTFTYVFADVDLAGLVEEAVAAANATGASVVCDVQSGLPDVHGDSGRLRQLLSNLIDNAVKFSPPAGTVEVEAKAVNGGVRVVVTDHGPGIAAEHHELIFQQFGRVDRQGEAGLGASASSSARVDRRGARRDARGLVGSGRGRHLHALAACGLGLAAARPQLALELAGACRHALPQIDRREDHGLAAERQHLADQPLGAADGALGHG